MLLQHMHKKEFWILTNEYGNVLKHGNEADRLWPLSLVFMLKGNGNIFFFINKSKFTSKHIKNE